MLSYTLEGFVCILGIMFLGLSRSPFGNSFASSGSKPISMVSIVAKKESFIGLVCIAVISIGLDVSNNYL